FIDADHPSHVYKLKKALYGLKHAPRAWFDELSKFLLQNHFFKGTIDSTLFIRRFQDDILVVQVYVDDIIFGSTHPRYIQLFSDLMKSRFEMSMMREMTFFLGLQVNQSPCGIFINQSKYVLEILNKYGMESCDLVGTPMEIKDKLDLDQNGTPVDATKYRSMIGENLVSWSLKKQDYTVLSTAEAEYVSLSACCAQVLWIRTQLTDYGFHFNKFPIYCDSKSAIAISCNPIQHSRTKHIAVRYHFIKEYVEKGTIELYFVKTDYQLADIFTKALPTDRFNYLVRRLGRKFNFSKYIFDSMVRNVNNPSKFMMYPRFLQLIINAQVEDLSSNNNQYTSPALTQKVFANMCRFGKGFSGVETPLFASMLVQLQPQDSEEEDFEVPAAPTPPSPTHAPSPPPQAQPAPSSPPQEQTTDTSESSMTLLNTLMETCATLVKKLEKKKKSRSSGLKRLRKGRIDDVSAAATKEVNVAEPTLFDDEEVTMTMDQTLSKMKAEKARKYQSLKRKPVSIAQARKNMIIYLKSMAGYKMEHFRGMNYDEVRPIFKKEHNKVQTLFKPDKDVEEPQKKIVAEETLLHESFKKLKAVEVSGFESIQDTSTNDPKEMSEEDVQNMLEIVPVFEFKSFKDMLKGFDREDLVALSRLVKEKFSIAVPTVDKEKALWVELTRLFEPNADDVFWKLQRYMHDKLTWKLYTNYGVHHVSSTRRHAIFMLTEKYYPLSNAVMIIMLSAKLQVEENSEMARDLVMKIFMKAKKPKSKSLDTSSKLKEKALRDKCRWFDVSAVGSRLMLLGKIDTAAEVTKEITLSS
nr:hypothetical protein [Tanacetum cinerariifolium]